MTGAGRRGNVAGRQFEGLIGQNRESDGLLGIGGDPQGVGRRHLQVGQELLQALHQVGVVDAPAGNQQSGPIGGTEPRRKQARHR